MEQLTAKVALEEHFIVDSAEHRERWMALLGSMMMPSAARERIARSLVELGEPRLELMDRCGVELAVLSSVAIVQGVLDPTPALRIARETNDQLAEAVRAHPDRYAGFASVPLQTPDAGAAELERAVRELGLCGAMLFGHTNGLYLDDERFAPFWECAEALGVPVYLHAAEARTLSATYTGRPELLGAAWSWTAETAAHALRLVFGGVFERFPGAQLILGHLGEALPFLLWRIDARVRRLNRPVAPSELIRANITVTTSGTFSDEPLLLTLSALGEDSVMFSIDHPFEDSEEAAAWFERAPLSAEVKQKVAGANARRVLGLA